MAEEKKAGAGDKIFNVTDRVTFVVKYAPEFKGEKYMKEGEHSLHPLHAARLEKKKIGTIKK